DGRDGPVRQPAGVPGPVAGGIASPPAANSREPPRGASRRAYPSVAGGIAIAAPRQTAEDRPVAPAGGRTGPRLRRHRIAARGGPGDGPGHQTGGRARPSSAASPSPPTPDSRGRPGGVRSAVRRPRDKGTVARGAADGRTG